MISPGELTMVRAGAEFTACPACGYALGFHTSFISTNAEKGTPVRSTREVYRVILICPECGARFDVGWRVSFSELESRVVKTPAGNTVPVTNTLPAASQPVTVVPLPPALPPQGNVPHE
jgi:predicted RNA-binding Zn-ribbon protein involved in translation (DUF1610 family)